MTMTEIKEALDAYEQNFLWCKLQLENLRPKRKWVGLTDEEIDECDWGQSERDHARAIEAKLKEKNT